MKSIDLKDFTVYLFDSLDTIVHGANVKALDIKQAREKAQVLLNNHDYADYYQVQEVK